MKSKRVKRLAIATAILAVLVAVVLGVMSALGINLFSCTKKTDPGDAPESSVNISAAPPTDGSLPTVYSGGIENISYMVYVLNNQTSWHSFSDTDSIAAGGINDQKTYTYKDYKDGVLIASDMTYSSFVKSSTQTAYIGDGAYMRSGSKPDSKSADITEIVWNEGEPEYLERQSYYATYGLFADEISVFLLNEETVSSCGEVTDNGDGTYTQSFTLDPEKATYYYQFNMLNRGGLSSYPIFSTVNITFTFDASWQVLEVQTYEVSDVRMGAISTTNTSESHITYTYGDDCVDEYNYAFYENYFKQYVGNVSEGGSSSSDDGLEITEVLQYGFGDVLGGGEQYAIDVVIGETAYTGYIYASVDLNTLYSDTLGAMDIRLSLGKTADDQQLYLELSDGDINVYYSDSFAVSGNISELSLIINEITAWINSSQSSGTQTVAISKSLTADSSSEDDDVLTQLLSLFVITETDDSATLALKTDDLLGTGIGIDLTMEFAKDDVNVLSFTGASVNSVTYGGEELAVSVTLSSTDAEIITHDEGKTPVNLADFVADVYDLLSAELLEVSIAMDGNNAGYSSLAGFSVEATALVDINSVVVGADVYVNYVTGSGSLSAKLSAYYDYGASKYGNVYLCLYELDGKQVDVKLYCDVNELVEAITVLLGGESGDADGVTEEVSQSVTQIINSILSIDFSSVITQLYASGSQICLGVDLDEIMTLLGADLPSLGTAALIYDGESLALSLETLGLSMDVAKAAGGITEPDVSEYLDLSELVDEIYALINSRTFNLTLALDGDAENCTIAELSGLAVTMNASFDTQSLVLYSGAEISYIYQGSEISAKLDIYYVYDGENYGTIYVNIYEVCGADVSIKLCATVNEIDELTGGIISGITDSVDLSSGESAELSAILEAVVSFDFESAVTVLSSDNSQIELGLDADNILSQFGVDFSGIGVINLVYENGAFAATAENLGLNAILDGSNNAVALPADASNYMDVNELVSDVMQFIGSETITAVIDISDSNISYLEDVNVNGTVSYTVESGVLEVDMTAEYQMVSVALTAYYDGENVYILVKEICGAQTNLNVMCSVDELSAVLESLTGGTSGEVTDALDGVLTTVLSLDYDKFVTKLDVSANGGIYLVVDVDALLTELEVDLGVELGELHIGYNNSMLLVVADNLGLKTVISGGDGVVTVPEVNYLTVESVLALIENVKSEIAEIEASQSVYFEIDCYVTADGMTLGVEGFGEVDWSGKNVTVALDLTLSIQDGSSNPDEINVKLLYSGESVTIVVDGLGMTAAIAEISELGSGFEDLLEAIYALTGTSGSALGTSQTVSSVSGVDVTSELSSLLANDDLAEILTILLDSGLVTDGIEQLLNYTLSVDGTSAALGYVDGYTLTFTAKGGLALISASASGNENYIKVTSGAGLYASLESDINSGAYTIMSTEDGSKLTEVMYNYGLKLISNASIANTLGTGTYEVDIVLDGNNTAVSDLQGVYVEANLYYTDAVSTTAGSSKLTEMDVSISVEGETSTVTAVFNVIYYNESLYITLTEINGTKLGDLKMTVELGDVYAIADQLVEVLLNPNLSTFIANFTSDGGEDGGSSAASVQTEVAEEEATALSETLVKLLSLDFSDFVDCAKSVADDGTITRYVWVDIDGIYKAFTETENGIGLGEVTASYITATDSNGNITNREIYVAGEYGGAEWLSLGAYRTTARDYSEFDESEYWDLAFVNDFINDAINFATDDEGGFYTMYTFSGTLTAGISLGSLGDIGIEIEVLNLTIGFNDGGFYLSMLGNLSSSSVLWYTISEGYTIGLTYSNDYITLGRKLGTSSAEYKIVSISYFTDYLLESESPLRWLLGTSQSLWDMIISAVGADLSSGVTDVDTLNLTTGSGQTSTTLEEFYLSDYITGINAVINGETVTSSGDNYAASQLGLTDNYYAFDFNNEVLDSLTGSGITELYAAILRSDEQGISGLTACGKVGGVLDFNLTLDEYLEGVTQVYDVTAADGTATYEAMDSGDVTADNMFTMVESPDESDFASYYVYDADSESYVLASDNGGEYSSEATYYVPVYYILENGSYVLATEYDENATYYAISYVTAIKGFAAPDMWTQLTEYLAAKGVTINYADTYTDEYTVIFGCYDYALGNDSGTTTSQYAPKSFTLSVYLPDENGSYGENADQTYTLKYGSTVNAIESENLITVNGNPGKYVYYYLDGETKVYVGESFTFSGDTTLYAEFRNQVTVNYYNKFNQKIYTLTSYEGNDIVTVIDGYTLLGDVTIAGNDENTETISIRGTQNREIEISGEYVVTEYKVNGVVYTYNTTDGYYHISGTYADSGYTDSVLVLENEFDGYAVVAIDAGALSGAMNDGGNLSAVTTVIVPENITVIGGRSFYDCEYLQVIVFLADTITLETDGTTSGLGSDHGYPFYDCLKTLVVYYTNLDSSVDSSKCFEYYESWFTYSSVNTVQGGWTYTNGEIECSDSEIEAVVNAYLTDNGINLDGVGSYYDVDGLEENLQNVIDGYLYAEYGYVGYYRVEVEYTSSSDCYVSSITITVKSGYGEYYLFDITSEKGAVTINADDGDVYAYNGGTYVKAGASVYLTVEANGGNRFIGFSDVTGYGSTIEAGTAFTMPASKVSVTANYETYFETLYIYSAVGFTYGGTEYASGTVSISGEYTASSTLSTPAADGYIFLGWAYDKDGTLTFADEYMITDTYYAIWGVSSQTVTDYTVATSGTTLCDLTADGYMFLSWWVNDGDSWSQVTDIVSDASVVYEALWCSNVTVSVTYSTNTSSGFIKKTTVESAVTISGGELSGAIAGGIMKNYGDVSGYATYGSSSTSTLYFDGSDGSYSASASHTGSSAYTGVTITFGGITYSYGDWSVTIGDGTYSGTYSA